MQWRLDAARTPVVTVGRAAHNSVVLPDRSVSSEHALLVFDSANPNPNPNPNHPNPNAANAAASAASAANAAARGSAAWPRRALGWWARDRGSSNGTYLRLSVPKSASRPFALTPGHRLCAGSCTISVSRFACGVASACGRRPTMEVRARARACARPRARVRAAARALLPHAPGPPASLRSNNTCFDFPCAFPGRFVCLPNPTPLTLTPNPTPLTPPAGRALHCRQSAALSARRRGGRRARRAPRRRRLERAAGRRRRRGREHRRRRRVAGFAVRRV